MMHNIVLYNVHATLLIALLCTYCDATNMLYVVGLEKSNRVLTSMVLGHNITTVFSGGCDYATLVSCSISITYC